MNSGIRELYCKSALAIIKQKSEKRCWLTEKSKILELFKRTEVKAKEENIEDDALMQFLRQSYEALMQDDLKNYEINPEQYEKFERIRDFFETTTAFDNLEIEEREDERMGFAAIEVKFIYSAIDKEELENFIEALKLSSGVEIMPQDPEHAIMCITVHDVYTRKKPKLNVIKNKKMIERMAEILEIPDEELIEEIDGE